MFEQALFEEIQKNFKAGAFELSFGYGEIDESAKEPYIIQYTNDMDGTRQVLCNQDDFKDGRSFVQWNIYASNVSNADYIAKELMSFIAGLKQVGSYQIILNNHQSTRNFPNINTGLTINTISREFTYRKGD